jgi:hypothetical protein
VIELEALGAVGGRQDELGIDGAQLDQSPPLDQHRGREGLKVGVPDRPGLQRGHQLGP